jgi:uncharacterized OB-fold protein
MTFHPLVQPEPITSMLSVPTVDSEAFWRACDLCEFRLPQCCACKRYSYFPRRHCPHCGGRELTFESAPTTGTVHSFAHIRFSPFGDFWTDDLPYTVVRVDLDSSVRFLSRLVGARREEVCIGDRAEIQFAPVKQSERRIPVFALAATNRTRGA